MTILFITVFRQAGSTALGDPLQEEKVAIGAGSLKSNTISGSATSPVGTGKPTTCRLYAIADCFVTWGADPTALIDGSAGRALGADNPEYFNILSGDKIAVIQRV